MRAKPPAIHPTRAVGHSVLHVLYRAVGLIGGVLPLPPVVGCWGILPLCIVQQRQQPTAVAVATTVAVLSEPTQAKPPGLVPGWLWPAVVGASKNDVTSVKHYGTWP